MSVGVGVGLGRDLDHDPLGRLIAELLEQLGHRLHDFLGVRAVDGAAGPRIDRIFCPDLERHGSYIVEAVATRNAEMERAIRQQPEDEEPWLVYGDWLQAHGDPRGELVAIQSAQRERPDDISLRAEEARIIHQHREELLGELADHLDCVRLTWRFGFIHGVRVFGGPSLNERMHDGEPWTMIDLLEALFAHPSGQFVRELTVGNLGFELSGDRSVFSEWLASYRFPSTIRSLFLFDDVHGGAHFETIDGLDAAFPALDTLILAGQGLRLGGNLPKPLRYLKMNTGPSMQANLEQVSLSYLQALRRLSLVSPSGALVEVLHRTHDLKSLELARLDNSIAALTRIGETPAAAQIEHLEIVASGMTGKPDIPKRNFPSLRSVNLDANDLPEESIAGLRRVFESVSAAHQGEVTSYYAAYSAKWSLLGRLAHDLYSQDASRRAFAESRLRESQGAGTTLYNEGTHLLLTDDPGAAAPLLSLSLELADPLYYRQAWSNAGIAQANCGNFPAAVEIARRAIQRFAHEPNFYAILIDALRHQRLLDEAFVEMKISKGLIDGTPAGMALCQDHVFTHLVAGDSAAAAKVYDDFLSAGFTPRLQLMAAGGIARIHQGELARAKDISDRLRACRDPIVHHFRACWNIAKKRKARAREEIRQAAEKGYPELRYMREADPLLKDLQAT